MGHNYMFALKDLASDNPVIFYDQSGCGNSKAKDASFSNWTLDYFLQELTEFINHLGYKKVYLLGSSWGGTLATKYTLEHQERVAGLILASPCLSYPQLVDDSRKLAESLSPGMADAMVKAEHENRINTFEYEQASSMFYNNFLCRIEPWLQELLDSMSICFLAKIFLPMTGSNVITVRGNLENLDLTNDMAKITVPTLITCGKYDFITPASMQLCVDKMSNATLTVFGASSHMAFLEEPESYLKTIKTFLEVH